MRSGGTPPRPASPSPSPPPVPKNTRAEIRGQNALSKAPSWRFIALQLFVRVPRLPQWPELSGKAYIVTGGSQGLGRGLVRALAAEGARLAIVGRNAEAAAAAAREAEAQGVEAFAIAADVSAPADCRRIVAEAAARLGALDGLVNNAAHYAVTPLDDASPEAAARMFD